MTNWYKITETSNIPSMGARVIEFEEKEIAIFKTKDGLIFAVSNICPHKQGKLSEGLVHEHQITCPLHNWDIDLSNGEAIGDDSGCTNIYETKINEGVIYLKI